MIREEQIRTMIEEHVAESDKFLVKLSVSETGNINILMDGDGGFTIADCVALSRYIEHRLDREQDDFSLEVSSCGVGNPLVMPRQYRKNIGRLLETTLKGGEVMVGRIVDADEQNVEIQIVPEKKKKKADHPEPEIRHYPYTEIVKALIMIEF
ncbi:MAG: ribosome assembly cofactor RimP [Bacteroidales bacterium]